MPGTEQLVSQTLGVYRIERLLGKSQLGAAYLASEPERGIRVMVTTFNFPEGQSAMEREQFRARFAREGTILTRLAHANILPIYAFGEQPDYLYLVTAFVKQASLGQTLKQNTRLTPEQTLHILRQLAAGLDYAHSQGVTHGMLSLANVVVSETLEAGIAGFGLSTMLEIHGSSQSTRPLAHLSSPHGAFLGSPEYIAPERVLGLACDSRVDIYALGVMLFALLSGVQPFRADTPLDVALQRLQQPAPLVHIACPSVPEAFDLVIGRAMERDPARRFQSAGELAQAFERVINAQGAAQQVGGASAGKLALEDQATMLPVNQPASDLQMTMPPTVNWFDDQVTPSGRWQVVQPSEKSQASSANMPGLAPGTLASSPYGTEKLDAPDNSPAAPGPRAPFPKAPGASLAGIDPFAWWSSHGSGRKPLPATPTAPARRVSLRQAIPGWQNRPQPNQQERRKLIRMAVGGTVAVGALTIGGITFAHLAQSMKQNSTLANVPTSPATSASSSTQTTSNATSKPTSKPTKAPTRAATKAPTHTGTVIGSTALAANSSHTFTNPADGASSLLIRLANGNYVACERACTHAGVAVNYDPAQKMIVCPAHGAIFDPANGFSHVSGPGNGPLTRVAIRVNGDGTITTG
jgi:serine/threonine protein kinase